MPGYFTTSVAAESRLCGDNLVEAFPNMIMKKVIVIILYINF